METKRSSFTGKLGFVLAAAGSAVGLGNIWRFPYLAAQYGGGIFLLVYLILAVTFGFALMLAEIAIGRKTGLSVVGAYKKLDKRFSFIGWLAALVPIIILPYYCVIGGWVTQYMFAFATGDATNAAVDGYFNGFISNASEPLLWFAIFLGATALVVLLGVDKGIEKISKIIMPILIVLTLFIAIYSICSMPGAIDGVLYYITPDFSKFSVNTVLGAMGQLFYSMSIAMGIMITYGSYMKKEVNVESSVHQIEIFDTGIAFLAGLMIIPTAYVFYGGNTESIGQGPGLMFATLPKVFQTMPGGDIIGAVFFFMVFFAALTSSISLMETVVSIFCDKFSCNRKLACLFVIVISIMLGVPSSLGNGAWSGFTIIGMDFLTFCDFLCNSVVMPIVALLTCILVGYIIKPAAIVEEVELSAKFKNKAMFTFVIKYMAPICIVLILVSSVLSGLGIVEGL